MKISTFNIPDTFTFDGNVDMLEGTDAVNKCLEMLVKVNKGELGGDPDFGSNFLIYCYEQNTDILNDQVTDDIVMSVSRYDDRIDINDNDIHTERQEEKILVNCNYYLKSEDSRLGISMLL